MSGRCGRPGIQTGGKMIQRQTRTLVVDDKIEHGNSILRALGKAGYPARFIPFSEEMPWEEEPLVGVRTVFMDLALLGAGIVSDQDRAAAQSVLEKVLDKCNGPWGLITWTSHAADGEKLFQHLSERMPVGLRPVTFATLDKELYLPEFKRVNEDKTIQLVEDVKAKLIPPSPIDCLLKWEISVQKAAATVLHELAKAAESATGDTNAEIKLSCLIHELAKAESGKNLTPGIPMASSLYPVLTPLLSDCLDQSEENSCITEELPCKDVQANDWQAYINRMLHIDSGDSLRLSPGCLIEIPVEEVGISQLDTLGTVPAKRGSRIRGLFLRFKETDDKNIKSDVANACKLFLIDITPPCDHAQKKSDNENYWRRFMLVCRVPLAYSQYLWLITKKDGNETREEGRLAGDHLYKTPYLSDETGGYVLVANANMIVSMGKSDTEKLPKPTFRIREQLFNHLLSWVGRHISRQGIVSLG